MSGMGLQLHAALQGNYDTEGKGGLSRVERALQAALTDYASDVQGKWRQDIAQSGLKNSGRLTKTVRQKTYKNQGLDPAARVYSTFPLLQRAFEQGDTIKGKDGLWLTIPNPEVWPEGRVRQAGGRGQQRQSSVAIATRRFGPLRFIYNPHGASMLVTDARRSKTRAGTFRYASPTAKRRGNVQEIVVFFLVKQARLPRLLRGSVIRDRTRRDAAREIDKRFIRFFEQDAGPAQLTGPSND